MFVGWICGHLYHRDDKIIANYAHACSLREGARIVSKCPPSVGVGANSIALNVGSFCSLSFIVALSRPCDCVCMYMWICMYVQHACDVKAMHKIM